MKLHKKRTDETGKQSTPFFKPADYSYENPLKVIFSDLRIESSWTTNWFICLTSIMPLNYNNSEHLKRIRFTKHKIFLKFVMSLSSLLCYARKYSFSNIEFFDVFDTWTSLEGHVIQQTSTSLKCQVIKITDLYYIPAGIINKTPAFIEAI